MFGESELSELFGAAQLFQEARISELSEVFAVLETARICKIFEISTMLIHAGTAARRKIPRCNGPSEQFKIHRRPINFTMAVLRKEKSPFTALSSITGRFRS